MECYFLHEGGKVFPSKNSPLRSDSANPPVLPAPHAHSHAHTPAHTCKHAHMHTHTPSQALTCSHTRPHMLSHVRAHMLTHAHMLTRTHTHMPTHTHTHAHTCSHAHREELGAVCTTPGAVSSTVGLFTLNCGKVAALEQLSQSSWTLGPCGLVSTCARPLSSGAFVRFPAIPSVGREDSAMAVGGQAECHRS